MSEDGSMLPMVGGLVLATLLVLILALDVSLYAAAVREAAFAADVGAAAGAAHIDPGARYEGVLVLDEVAAVSAAESAAGAARPRGGRQVVVETTPDRICVTVRQPFRARLVPVDTPARAKACAVPVEG